MNILLDLDGTLTDPREGIVGCIKHALNGLALHCPGDAELARTSVRRCRTPSAS
jgi:phosphoglycolate phosphatase